MGVLKNLAIFFICVTGIAALVSFVLPTTWEVSRELQIGVDSRMVHEYTSDVSQWHKWSHWGPLGDPTSVMTPGEKTQGEGASISWVGADVGKGIATITAEDRDKGLWFNLSLRGGRERVKGVIEYGELPAGTVMAKFSLRGDVSGNPIGRYLGLFRNYTVGPDIVEALSRLKKITESRM